MNEQQKDRMSYQLSYRKAERDKADLMYENQQLRSKVTALTMLLIATIVIFVAAIFINAS